MPNLHHYRHHPEDWPDLGYQKDRDSAAIIQDAHEKARYSVLIELQYDRRESDYALIRYLFEEEVESRREDDYQGLGPMLQLGAFLLAGFQRAEDIALLYAAKTANFDTSCGLDLEFVFWPLGSETLDYLEQHHPGIYTEIVAEYLDSVDELMLLAELPQWWEKTQLFFPEKPEQQGVDSQYERALYFGDIESARVYLNAWAQTMPDSEQTRSFLKHAYRETGQYERLLPMAQAGVERAKNPGFRISCLAELLEVQTLAGLEFEGMSTVASIESEAAQFDEDKAFPVSDLTLQALFNHATACEDRQHANTAFALAHSWVMRVTSLSLVAMESAHRAALHCGCLEEASGYQTLIDHERSVIDDFFEGI